MKKRKRWVSIVLAVFLFGALTVAAIEVILPFINPEGQTLTRSFHKATHVGKDSYAFDFARGGCAGWGTDVVAVLDGTVIRTETGHAHGEIQSYGNQVVIDHGDGITSRYAHLEEVLVSVDADVLQGDIIGRQGNTGSVTGTACMKHPGTHLHFVMYKDGQPLKPDSMSGYTDFVEWQTYIPSIQQVPESTEKYGPRRFDSPLAWGIKRFFLSLIKKRAEEPIAQAVGGVKVEEINDREQLYEYGQQEEGEEREHYDNDEEVGEFLVKDNQDKVIQSVAVMYDEIEFYDQNILTNTLVTTTTTTLLARVDEEESVERWREIPRNGSSGGSQRGVPQSSDAENDQTDQTVQTSQTSSSTSTSEQVTSTSYVSSTEPTVATTSTMQGIDLPTESQRIVFNEINWMGTSRIKNASVNCTEHEWIELYNPTSSSIDLYDWVIEWDQGSILLNGRIDQQEYYLLAKKHARKEAIQGMHVDQYFEGVSLPDDGADVLLKDSSSTIIDALYFKNGWPAGTVQGADKHMYQPMARLSSTASSSDPLNWETDQAIRPYGSTSNCGKLYGSPGRENRGEWLLEEPAFYYAGLDQDNILTLTKEESPYIFSVPTNIPKELTLRIEPGVVLVGSHPDAYLNVYGRLELLGTEAEPIILTSARDREHSHLSLSLLEGDTPEPGDWSRLELQPGSSAQIQHVEFRYGGQPFLIERDGFFHRDDGAQVIRVVSSTVGIVASSIKYAMPNIQDHEFTAGLWIEDSSVSIDAFLFDDMEVGLVLAGRSDLVGTSTLEFMNVDTEIDDRRSFGTATEVSVSK